MASSENPAALELVPQQEGICASPRIGQGTPGVPSRVSRLVRTEGRVTEIVMFEEQVVGFFLEAAKVFGVPKSVALIYGLCFASPEPLSFADLNKRLYISQGSISQGLKLLREFGALRVVQPDRPEARLSGFEGAQPWSARCREFYAPDLKLRELATRWIEQRWERQLLAGSDRLKAMIEAVSPDRGDSEKLTVRIKCLENLHQQSQAMVPVFKAILGQ